MRSLSIGLLAAAIGAISTSHAADLDYGYLRGADEGYAEPVIDWSGVYLGGHGGYSSGSFGFKDTAREIIANAMRQTTVEKELSISNLLAPRDVRNEGGSFGAFAGYNLQFDNLVIGIEADYTRANLVGLSGDSIGRQAVTSDGFKNYYNLTTDTKTDLQDFGTIRARAGYAVGSFLPFITGGVAIGRARISDNVGLQRYGYDQATYRANQGLTDGATPAYVGNYGYYPGQFSQTNPESSTPLPMKYYERVKTKTVGGVALGGGLEYAVTSNILLRGEYQYVLFNDFDGHRVNLNTVRGGAALKF